MQPPKATRFPNPRDAACAACVWVCLVLVFLAYLVCTFRTFLVAVHSAHQHRTFNQRVQTPEVRLDICELQVLAERLNYSLLEHLRIDRELEFMLPNGTEINHHDSLNATSLAAVDINNFRCIRVHSMQQVPQESVLPYHRWWLSLEGPIHPELQRNNFSYVSGLFARPSLAENASHPVSLKEEHFLKLWVPFLAEDRWAVVQSTAAMDKWTDSLGGRWGAPYEDTFFFRANIIVPGALQMDGWFQHHPLTGSWAAGPVPNVSRLPRVGHRLKIVLPIPTTQVQVHEHFNDLTGVLIAWLGRLASGAFIFSVLTMMFPSVREEKFRLFLHLPSLGFGCPETEPLQPLQP
ncbi:unnamed protein product [Effrenium voratum]|nr:unnamed protein product [Effrenium voratum]